MSTNRVIEPTRAQVVEFPNVAGRNLSPESLEEELQQLREQAHQEGFSAGEKAGLEIAEQRTEVQLYRYSRAIEELAVLKAKIFKESEAVLLHLVCELAEAVIRRKVVLCEETLVPVIRQGLEKLAASDQIRIFLNPTDLEILRKQIGSTPVGIAADVAWISRDDLDRGDCVFESTAGSINARIVSQLQELTQDWFPGEGEACEESSTTERLSQESEAPAADIAGSEPEGS